MKICVKYSKTAMLFFIVALLSIVVYAVPAVPHQFLGTVTSDGNPVADDLLITVKIDGNDVAATVTKDSSYGLSPDIFYVQDIDNNRNGKTLEFFVDGKKAVESIFINGESTELNLDVSGLQGPVFCGDNTCNGDETCSTCSADCGSCSNGGGGGSPVFAKGGGGGGPVITTTTLPTNDTVEDTTCTPDWTCSDWLDCINDNQKRICVDSSKCDDDSTRPSEEQGCVISASDSLDITEGGVPDKKAEKGLEDITGAVIGGTSRTALTIGLILVVLATLVAAILLYRKNR